MLRASAGVRQCLSGRNPGEGPPDPQLEGRAANIQRQVGVLLRIIDQRDHHLDQVMQLLVGGFKLCAREAGAQPRRHCGGIAELDHADATGGCCHQHRAQRASCIGVPNGLAVATTAHLPRAQSMLQQIPIRARAGRITRRIDCIGDAGGIAQCIFQSAFALRHRVALGADADGCGKQPLKMPATQSSGGCECRKVGWRSCGLQLPAGLFDEFAVTGGHGRILLQHHIMMLPGSCE